MNYELKDKSLEELFLAGKPHFDDKTAFMAKLTRRLDAVEYLRQYQEATIRRYRMAVVAAFVVGILSGGVAIAFLLSTPANVPLFTFSVQNAFLVWLAENSRLISATGLALLMSFGIFTVINIVQEIINMRVSMRHYGL